MHGKRKRGRVANRNAQASVQQRDARRFDRDAELPPMAWDARDDDDERKAERDAAH
jgi:hypothetical protein